MKKITLKALFCALLVCSQIATAQLYRCGNTYQDSACANAASAKPISKSGAVKNTAQPINNSVNIENQPILTVDVDCKQRGEAAKKIMWMREIGKTADDQIATPPDGASSGLIRDVYNHKGSSLQVQDAIQQECMQQKEKDKLAVKLMAEAERLRGGGSLPVTASTERKASPLVQEVQEEGAVEISQKSNVKQENCHMLKANSDSIAAKRRKGGSGNYMDSLRQKQNQIEIDMKLAGC